MDYNRLNVSVTDSDDVIAKIRSFLRANVPGPNWIEDGMFTLAGNPGEFFVRTAADTGYLIFDNTPDDGFIHVGHAGDNAAASGYGDGTGPAAAKLNTSAFVGGTGKGVGLYVPANVAGAPARDSKLHMFADDTRCVIVLEVQPDNIWSMLYAGFYEPGAAGADDASPLCIVSNSAPGSISSAPTGVAARFPNGVVKVDPRGNRRVFVGSLTSPLGGVAVQSVPGRESSLPMNDRADAAEVFTHPLHVVINELGCGEWFSLSGSTGTDGILRASDGLKPGTTVELGAGFYFVAPLSMTPDGSSVLIGPIGDAI